MNKTIFIIKLSSILIILSSLFTPFLIGAEENINLGMKVSPQIFEITVRPGEEMSKKVRIGNTSSVALPLEVRLTDFTAEENSGEMIFDEALQDPSIASRKWFNIENPNFILEAGESEDVNFTIAVPEDAEPGGHYAVMLFEPRLPSFYFEEHQVRNVPVIGVVFLISVRNLFLEQNNGGGLEIVDFSLPKEQRITGLENIFASITSLLAQTFKSNVTEDYPSTFILKIKNNDIYHAKPYGIVSIYNFFGKKVGEAQITKKTVLPGKTRDFPVEFKENIPEELNWLPASVANLLVKNSFIGRYSAKLELRVESPLAAEVTQPSIYNTLTFYALPWKFWMPVLIAFALVIKYRNRIKAALKVLIKGKKDKTM